ncbi:MAG TPA: AAA family ATPase, partial [Sphingomonas sp.]|nr:AAA family ATPase [Sphingomonas sp.]
MRIRRLKLSGFKSFVDPAELVIEPGLTGVVGPNGCGKSNLLEAIRWVMGEASPKSLRGGGMEDVIFAGTAQRPARDFAEVTMLLERPDESGRAIEAEVVRRIERGAGSAYRVDGRDVRQKDVALLFADAATGAHSPALVSQGRVAALISAKPAERRAMLEEAAGIAGLHVRRRDAEQNLRATEANLERLQQLIGDMEARAAALRRQARAAQRYRQITAELRVAEARLIWARWREAAEAAEAAKREAQAAEARVAEAGEAQRLATEKAGEATRHLAAARSAAQSARDIAASAGHRLETLRTELASAERRIAELGRLREELERDRAREGALAEDAAAAIQRLGEEIETLTRRIAEGEQVRPAAAARLAETEAGLRDAEVALAQALAAEAAEQAEARIARAAEAAARQRLDRAEGEVARIVRDRSGVGDAEGARAAMAEVEATRAEAETEAVAAGEAIAAAEADRSAASAARDEAQARAATAKAELASLEGEAAALRRSLPARSAERAIDALTVKPGYERALAAALADDLDAPIGREAALRWEGADGTGDAALPAHREALAAHVQAPPALARRLAQVIVAEADDGAPLAVGRRLVTLDGRMRRWDGFVAEDVGAAAAEALVRRNRLAALDALIPPARAAFEGAESEAKAAVAALEAAARAGQEARTRLSRAEQRARETALAEDRARLAIERIEARAKELDERAAAAEIERVAAAQEAEGARAAVAALPDGAETARAVAAQRAATDRARGLV